MPTELINLELDELSLVPKGANPMAKAPIFKALNGDTMSDETLEKMAPEMDAKIKEYMEAKGCDRKTAMDALMKSFDEAETLTADVEKLKVENERLRKSFLDEGYTIEADKVTKAAVPEYVEYDGEQINKADIPAPILKALEAAEVEKADATLTKRAEATLPHFDVVTAKGLLSAVEKMDDAEILIAALEAADKAFADKMEEFGKSSAKGEFASTKDALDAMVKEYQDTNNVGFHKAYAEVAKTEAGKALINKSYKDKE